MKTLLFNLWIAPAFGYFIQAGSGGVYAGSPTNLPAGKVYGTPVSVDDSVPADISDAMVETLKGNAPCDMKPVIEPGAAGGGTGQVQITANPTLIAYRNECRRAIKVTNLTAVAIFLGFSPSVGVNSGDLLPGAVGAFVIIPSILDIWGIVAAGATANVSFMEISD